LAIAKIQVPIKTNLRVRLSMPQSAGKQDKKPRRTTKK
jgi:hypothetical protein